MRKRDCFRKLNVKFLEDKPTRGVLMFSRRFLLSLTCTALLFAACSKEDESAAAETAPAPQAKEEAQPEFSDMEELRSDAQPVKSVETDVGVPQPASHGLYVLQVGVWDNAPSARKQAKELEANGIPAYVVKVENPGGLQGEFWRVRIGYFSTVPDARKYGETLKSKGIAFWIDNKSNDDVGSPAGSASASDDYYDYPTATMPAEDYPSVTMPAEQAAPTSEQVTPSAPPPPAPAETVTPEVAPEAPAASVAPETTEPVQENFDDGWN